MGAIRTINEPVSFRWPLGSKAKDKITGFEGTIAARSNHITGCDTYGLCPAVDKDGKCRDWGWFDEGRIELIEEDVITTDDVKAHRGAGAGENPVGLKM